MGSRVSVVQYLIAKVGLCSHLPLLGRRRTGRTKGRMQWRLLVCVFDIHTESIERVAALPCNRSPWTTHTKFRFEMSIRHRSSC